MPSQITNEQILFTRGVPAPEALPNLLLSECFQAALEGPDNKGVLQYGHYSGYLPLRKLVAEQYAVSSDNVLVGNGSLHLQDLLANMLIRPGSYVFVEQPSYDRAIQTFRRRGAKVIGIPLEDDGVNISLLEQTLRQQVPTFMYIIPDFQNPAGITTSAIKREALVNLAQRYGFWLIEDIPYRTLRYAGSSIPLLRDINPAHVITISSYSKLISPALRVGYTVAPVEIIKPLSKLTEGTILAPVLPTQAAVFEFHQRGYFATNLENLKQLYAPRLQSIIQAIKIYLPSLSFAETEGGFFISITLPPETEGTNLLARAQQIGLVLTDGRDFFADPINEVQERNPGECFIRLPFCALTPVQIDEGIKRLASLLKA